MGEVKKLLLEKLQQLSPERLAEVEDFVDFLANRDRRRRAFDDLLKTAPAIEAAGYPPLSEQEIAEEIAAARAEHRKKEPTGP